jgi:YD repeat-containing protein
VNQFNLDTYTGEPVCLGKDILGGVRSATDDYGALEDCYEYDAFGKPYKGYDRSGRETARVYGNGVRQETQYDTAGRVILIREVDARNALLRAEGYVYDATTGTATC